MNEELTPELSGSDCKKAKFWGIKPYAEMPQSKSNTLYQFVQREACTERAYKTFQREVFRRKG